MITVTKDSWLLFEKPDSKTEEYFSHPSDERQRTQELMQSHPDWTAEEALAAARNGGLRFGPSDEGKLLRQLPLKELGEIYGSLRIQRVEFTLMREHEKDAEWWFTELEWDISAKVRGTNKTLQMTVDPFTGRIFALHFFPR
jgi:hypothetical protein